MSPRGITVEKVVVQQICDVDSRSQAKGQKREKKPDFPAIGLARNRVENVLDYGWVAPP